MKSVQYRAFSGPYIPVLGVNTEIYPVNLRIQSEYRKILTRKNSVFEHFSRSATIDGSECENIFGKKNWFTGNQFVLQSKVALSTSVHAKLLVLEIWFISRCGVKYTRIRVFSGTYFLSLYGKIRVRENPHSDIFYALREQEFRFKKVAYCRVISHKKIQWKHCFMRASI